MTLVYPELRKLARKHLRSERSGHTLSTTALAHEAYLKLADADIDWSDRTHFFAVVALAMRRVLVDHGRRIRRQKRDGDRFRVTYSEDLLADREQAPDIVEVDAALKRLAETDERQAQVIELCFFGGLTYQQMAEVLGVSPTTIKRDLRFAKAWLSVELSSSTRAAR